MSLIRPVPIWLCVFLVIGYIVAGTKLFSQLEQWGYLDSAYFCFITLTTIGEWKKLMNCENKTQYTKIIKMKFEDFNYGALKIFSTLSWVE
jgi:hypothetical protein